MLGSKIPISGALPYYMLCARSISPFFTSQISMFDPAEYPVCSFLFVFHLFLSTSTWLSGVWHGLTPDIAKAEGGAGIFILCLESFKISTSVAITSQPVCKYFHQRISFSPQDFLKCSLVLWEAGLQLNTTFTFKVSFFMFSFLNKC